MRDVIGRILEGDFGCRTGSLDFSCSKLELSLKKGESREGFFVAAAEGQPMSGFVTSSDPRMECLTARLSGCREEIAYCFHGEYLTEGETVKGEFHIVSNHGEYLLPFMVSVEDMALSSSAGNIKNLFHFANLAKSSWTEAVRLFYHPEFGRVFAGSDARYYESYRGLRACPGNEWNVEEFLITVHKKDRIEYRVKEEAVTLDQPYGVTEAVLTVVRTGWGYTSLKVAWEGDFLSLEKEILTEDDFLGQHCRLPVYIDGDRLKRGKNFGEVVLTCPYLELTGTALRVPVTVHSGHSPHSRQGSSVPTGGGGSVPAFIGKSYREEKQLLLRLTRSYLQLRLKKIGTGVWLKEADKLVERMRVLDDQSVAPRLFQAQLLITAERYSEAKWILDHARNMTEDPETDAYYQYLTTLLQREESYVEQAAQDVERIYRKDRTRWRLAWLLLYLSKEYRSAANKWEFLLRQLSGGCTSPLLYLEALLLFQNYPSFLRKLGANELAILHFGVKYTSLSAEILEQLLSLAGRGKEYSGKLLRILEACYPQNRDVRILQEICSLLIRGGKIGPAYFAWYRLGVEQELRITKLYEFYMESLDMETSQEIPKPVLMYFSYQNPLDWERSAFLYAYVINRRTDYPDLYLSYRERMERFTQEQIRKERMNPHLAVVYREMLAPSMVSEQTAPALCRLLFSRPVRPGGTGVRRLVVLEPGRLTERVYPVTARILYVPVYDREAVFLLEDGEGNRYAGSVDDVPEQPEFPPKYIRLAAAFVRDDLDFHLYDYQNSRDSAEWGQDHVDRAIWLMKSPLVSPEVKREVCMNVLSYLYAKDEIRLLSDCLEDVPVRILTGKDRQEVLRYMMACEKSESVYEWVSVYGPGCADRHTLLRLCGQRLRHTGYEEDPVLTGAAMQVFRFGKYDESILRYLARVYRGRLPELEHIWKRARSFDVECYELAERILIQTLFTVSAPGEQTEVFRYYLSQGAKPRVAEAFLSQCAYDFLVKDIEPERLVFEEMRSRCRREPLNQVCRLAFLKYYAGKTYDDDLSEVLAQYLTEMAREGIRLNFFRKFREFKGLLGSMRDKTILEYRTSPDARAVIHYLFLHENGTGESYRTQPMDRVLGGLYRKEFILFFGESLLYHIMEEDGGEERLTESGRLEKNDGGADCGGKFELINDIVISRTLADDDTLDCLLEEFYFKEYAGERLFRLR
ncbi:MAG: DUF5717 family protein [Clostridium sp.]|jgi:hypothetical protein|nr:DUF5717 family protein [Clostridium sp.]